MNDLEVQLKVLNKIIAASDAEVNDYNWMINCISEYGLFPFIKTRTTFPDSRYTQNGLMQVPSEFASFCNYISNLYIENAIEIGVYRGRSSYFICALLYRKNKNLKYYMVDINDQLDNFEVFSQIVPCVKKIPATSDDFKGQKFDFVFIDGDHSYDGSMQDFLNVGQYTNKIVCFHDIYAHEYDNLNGGTTRTWNEVSNLDNFSKLTFSQFPDQWMGIGVCIKNPLPNEQTILTDTVRNEINNFKEFMNNNKRVYLYGAGALSEMYTILAAKFNKKFDAYVISDNQVKNNASINNLPVYHLKELKDAPDECRFVLSLSDAHHDIVMDSLRKRGYQHIYRCSEDIFSSMYYSVINNLTL